MNRWSGLLLAVACAVFHAAAWSFESGSISASLGWIAVFFTVAFVQVSRRRFSISFVTGCLVYLLGFFWLYRTIKDFGGFPTFVAIPIFGLFVAGSALQFVIYSLFFRFLPDPIKRYGCAEAVAWIAAENLWIRIFPWEPGHTQLGYLPLAQAASIAGVPLITFVMFWVCGGMIRGLKTCSSWPLVMPLLVLGGLIFFGSNRLHSSQLPSAKKLTVAIIQANVQLFQAHDMLMFEVNKQRYVELSAQVAKPNTLIIWPEAVNNEFVSDSVTSITQTSRLPHPPPGTSLLFGGLTFDDERRAYNSSLAISQDGTVLKPYHKMILMPFGEYMPFSGIIPSLEKLLPAGAGFTPGSDVAVLDIESAKVAPLICYEDLIPALSRKASLKGAQLLVNQTNDVWFGKTIAPYQHHRIASFRSIETSRFLVRSTNTGFSGIVDAFGRTVGSIREFSDGTLVQQVDLSDSQTIYSEYVGEMPIAILSWIVVAVCLIRIRNFRATT